MFYLSQKNHRIALLLGIIFTSFFFLISPHLIIGSNNGAYVAMVRNWQKGDLYCDQETFAYLGGVSFAQVGDQRLPDRNIGLSLLTYPLQILLYPAKALMDISYKAQDVEQDIAGNHSDRDDVYPIHSFLGVTMHFIPAIFGGFSVSLLYLLFNQRFHAPRLNICLAASFALGTCFLPFAFALFNHIISVFLVLLSLALYFSRKAMVDTPSRSYYVMLGACLGYMSLIDYTLIIYGIGMLLILSINRQYFGDSNTARRQNIIAFLMAGGIPVAIYLLYNTMALGKPWLTPYSLHGFYLYARDFNALMSGNWLDGLRGLLLLHKNNGVFVSSPMLIFGFLTIAHALKKREYDIIIFAGIILVHWLFTAKLFEWHGGGNYPRYILWSIMMLAVFSGFGCIDSYKNNTRSTLQTLLLLVFMLCSTIAIYNSIANFSYPGQAKYNVFLLQPAWLEALQYIGLSGAVDILLLLWLLCVILAFIYVVHFCSNKRFYFTLRFACCVMGIIFLPVLYALQNPWVQDNRPSIAFNKTCLQHTYCAYNILVDNYYTGLGHAPPDGYMMPYDNITLAGSVMFPHTANKPATIRYNIKELLEKSRKRLKVDFTLGTSVANYVAIRTIYVDGTSNTLLKYHSDGIEKRYMAMLDISNIPDYESAEYIELEMFVDDKAVTNADARIHAMAIY